MNLLNSHGCELCSELFIQKARTAIIHSHPESLTYSMLSCWEPWLHLRSTRAVILLPIIGRHVIPRPFFCQLISLQRTKSRLPAHVDVGIGLGLGPRIGRGKGYSGKSFLSSTISAIFEYCSCGGNFLP